MRRLNLVLLQALVAVASRGLAQLSVGPNVHVSVAHANEEHYEMFLAIDPRNGNRMIACSIISPAKAAILQTIAYVSTDGGKTWSASPEEIPEYGEADPGCGIGVGGPLYHLPRGFITSGTEDETSPRVYRPPDGGPTMEGAAHPPPG